MNSTVHGTGYDMQDDVQILLDHQHESGAWPACAGYSQYPYCWLRDGSFIAHAMDAVGEHDRARRFHGWVARAVTRLEPEIRELIAAREAGENVDHDRMPPARFRLDGTLASGGWPDFQIDGYGQWLWSLGEHTRSSGGEPAPTVRAAAELVADYLEVFWNEPCFDAWEEGRTQLHTSTLASAVAGLRAAAEWLDDRHGALADTAWGFVRERCTLDGRFTKSVRNGAVDASLVWLATPFGLVDDDDPDFRRTLDRIEAELVSGGGVTRYLADTFYGGGGWILLTAWLAWHHARSGRPDRAEPYLQWIEETREERGGLPEQVPVRTTDPWFLRYWTQRWGPSARPLLWSHAMTLLANRGVRR